MLQVFDKHHGNVTVKVLSLDLSLKKTQVGNTVVYF